LQKRLDRFSVRRAMGHGKGFISRPAAVLGTVVMVFALMATLLMASTAHGATVAYPDLQVQVPSAEISIGHPTAGARALQFSHVTWNAGAGPFELRPQYNSSSGMAQGVQALYDSAGGAHWTFDHTVPVVGPMVWEPPSDYRFPLTKFWLYRVASGGGVGSLVATSPKVDFCITPDQYVGGVPNTPPSTAYSPSNCGSPTGTLGLDVGWGDKYDETDGGENIDITNLPDGNYWLRAQVDPLHYLAESNRANDITDSELAISGNTVTVLKQTHPDSTPPTVSVTAPAPGTKVSGTVSLTAAASGPAPISKVQFLLDGHPLGAPVTSSPYSMTWTVGSATPGVHYLSAQATDSHRFIGTAPAVAVNVIGPPITIGSIVSDQQGTASGSGSTVVTHFSTSSPKEVLLAFVGADGPLSGQTAKVSGGGLTWRLVKRTNANGGTSEIWTATAAAALTNASITATAAHPGFHLAVTALALKGAARVGASAAATSAGGAPTVSLTTTAAGSALFAGGNDWDNSTARTVGAGQKLLAQTLDSATGDTYWSQYARAASSAAGQRVTVNDTAPASDRYNLVAVEVVVGTPPVDNQPPTVSIVNPEPFQTVSGASHVSANVSDNAAVTSVQFFLDGRPLRSAVTSSPYSLSWDTTVVSNGGHTLTATALDPSGNRASSSPVLVTVQNPPVAPPCFVMDVDVSVDGSATVTTPAFHTAQPGETLLALGASDGPAGGGRQSLTVSGAGLKWTLVKRANSRSGDAEIWKATAPAPLSNATVTAIPTAGGYHEALTVIAMQMTQGVGASAAAGATGGAASVSVTTTGPGSLVFGVGNDWDRGLVRTLGADQVLLHQWVDTSAGNTFWAQNTNSQAGRAGSTVTLDDLVPTADQWNMAAVELRGDGD
jgi:hypothetical protein